MPPRRDLAAFPRLSRHHKYGNMAQVKTTIELPDVTFRRAKAFAAVHGITMRRFITDAIERQLRRNTVAAGTVAGLDDATSDLDPEPPWMAGFGGLSDLGDEHRLVLAAIEEEFESLAPDDIP